MSAPEQFASLNKEMNSTVMQWGDSRHHLNCALPFCPIGNFSRAWREAHDAHVCSNIILSLG